LRYALQINPNDASLSQYLSQIGGAASATAPSKTEQDYQAGIKYMQAHQYQYAAYSFNQCTTEDPNSAKGWQGLGNAFYAEAQKEKAIAAWKHALAIDPGNAQLATYVDSIEGPSANAAPEEASASSAPAPQAKSSGINPWIMGGTIAALGAVMLFLF
jgi:tetratricopeptide (TPR) repeat protein